MKACIEALMGDREDVIKEAKQIYSTQIMINSSDVHGHADGFNDT